VLPSACSADTIGIVARGTKALCATVDTGAACSKEFCSLWRPYWPSRVANALFDLRQFVSRHHVLCRRTTMRKVLILAVLALIGGLAPPHVLAQSLPYREGKVLQITAIRVKYGKFFEFWDFLSKSYRPKMDEAKRQGLIVSYSIYSAVPHTADDANLYLLVEFPNYAAFDGLDVKLRAIDQKLFALSPQKADQGVGERDSLRSDLGHTVMRELLFTK
jgi:hypothetical protein